MLKDVGDFYQISESGMIFSKERVTSCSLNDIRRKKRKQIKTHQDKDGYEIASLYFNGKQRHLRVHRLVAQAFIPNPEGKPHVNHIDGNKSNNAVSNLEWATQSENELHAIRFLNKKQPKGAQSRLSTKMIVTFPDGHEEIMHGQNEAARILNLNQANIYKCLSGEAKSTKGYKFKKAA